jgi:hypothetical protein
VQWPCQQGSSKKDFLNAPGYFKSRHFQMGRLYV